MASGNPADRINPATLELIDRALEEDGARNDVSTLWTVPEDTMGRAVLYSRQEGILCGTELFSAVFERFDPATSVRFAVRDGESIRPDQAVGHLEGPARSLLSAERVALNFLGRLSGIATAAAEYTLAVRGTKAVVCDTRKTTPLLRSWEKYAVLTGGGTNHRFNLSDQVLLKDNHIRIAGGIANVLRAAKKANQAKLEIEIEVDTLEQLEQALDEGVDRILLDNMSPETLRRAVAITAGRAILEASGGVVLENIRSIAETGVDLISVGALTHSVKCFDFSLEMS